MTHKYFTHQYEDEDGEFAEAAKTILSLPQEAFDRYSNPFEQKWTLREKQKLPEVLQDILIDLEQLVKVHAERFFQKDLLEDHERHYCGIFKYDPGDYLGAHVDAGISPITGKRKFATAILYLGEGEGDLELWDGHSCVYITPKVLKLYKTIPPKQGTLVVFQNNDYAWHSAARNNSTEPRLVMTVSYMSDDISVFENMRQRAYFIPKPGERWTPEMYNLRDKRSDKQKYQEVYRV